MHTRNDKFKLAALPSHPDGIETLLLALHCSARVAPHVGGVSSPLPPLPPRPSLLSLLSAFFLRTLHTLGSHAPPRCAAPCWCSVVCQAVGRGG